MIDVFVLSVNAHYKYLFENGFCRPVVEPGGRTVPAGTEPSRIAAPLPGRWCILISGTLDGSDFDAQLICSLAGLHFFMIAEDLKSRIDELSEDERHELAAYLTKLRLENDPAYWETIRRRVASKDTGRLIRVEEL